jgi:hypothetical protein
VPIVFPLYANTRNVWVADDYWLDNLDTGQRTPLSTGGYIC